MEESTLKFNVLEHKLVPEHRVLTDKESEEVLKALRVTKDQLPKIRGIDPAVQVLEKARKAPIPEGTIIKVTRISETAGVSEAYRLVVGR
jgi:DNA-directed RNA polymerase subunit H